MGSQNGLDAAVNTLQSFRGQYEKEIQKHVGNVFIGVASFARAKAAAERDAEPQADEGFCILVLTDKSLPDTLNLPKRWLDLPVFAMVDEGLSSGGT